MIIVDLFAGLGGEKRRSAIEARGHIYITLDLDPKFGCTISSDLFKLPTNAFEGVDFIWASPPCEAFSVASIGHHWGGGSRMYEPKTSHAILSQRLVQHTLNIMRESNPRLGWVMENPRGVLRKLSVVENQLCKTVTYCQYGDTRMKPTDLWFGGKGLGSWQPRAMCKNGDPCHEAAPRGARTGTQGIKGAAERAVVPWDLWDEILTVLEGYDDTQSMGR